MKQITKEKIKAALAKAQLAYKKGKRAYDEHYDTHSPASRIENILEHVSELIGGYGIEAYWIGGQEGKSWPEYEYVNMGDSYALTLVYDRAKGKFFITDIGTIVEETDIETENPKGGKMKDFKFKIKVVKAKNPQGQMLLDQLTDKYGRGDVVASFGSIEKGPMAGLIELRNHSGKALYTISPNELTRLQANPVGPGYHDVSIKYELGGRNFAQNYLNVRAQGKDAAAQKALKILDLTLGQHAKVTGRRTEEGPNRYMRNLKGNPKKRR
jgi:hypothetical protein